jgi:hypothetical protein
MKRTTRKNAGALPQGGEDVWDEIITPSPQALDAALRQLNGDTTTALVLEHHGRRLYVGGGPDWFNILAHLGYDTSTTSSVTRRYTAGVPSCWATSSRPSQSDTLSASRIPGRPP